MAAYLIVQLTVTDPVAYETYRAHVPALIAAHGGRYLIRGGALECLEGPVSTQRQVVLEFPDLAAAHAFYDDPAYQPLKQVRQNSSVGTVQLVQGV